MTIAFVMMLGLSGCTRAAVPGLVIKAEPEGAAAISSRFLRITGQEPDTGDAQCTEEYDIALNVFDRLVEVEVDADRNASLVPSLAESWEISDDGFGYAFHLREGIKFSNSSALTASDVEYTLIRALPHPDSNCGDIGIFILGAEELQAGEI